MNHAFAAIGRAVVFAQLLEAALVPVFEFFKMKTDDDYMDKTGGYIPIGAFKVPISAMVRQLSQDGRIASDLEARLLAYVDSRNTLVHRWVLQRGWPLDSQDPKDFEAVVHLAAGVEEEAKSLTQAFATYMATYANPDWAAKHPAEYETAIANLFHKVHRA